ncbi:MAG: hypothetical protein ACOCUH_02610, partial [Bacteriovoracia bacterium]
MLILTRRLSILIISLIMCGLLQAKVQKLVEVTNEEDKDIIHLQVVTDKDNKEILEMQKRVYDKNNKLKDEFSNDYKVKSIKDGLTLYKIDKYEVVNLKSKNFAAHNGGHIEIDYLENGIKGSRDNMEVELIREGKSWALAHKGEKIEKMHMKS